MTNDTITVTVTSRNRGAGTHTTIVDSPYAEALAVIDELYSSSDATYKRVRFGRDLQRKMCPVLRIDDYRSPEWEAIVRDGSGPYTFSRAYLDTFVAAAAAIEAAVAKAVPAAQTHACAGHRDGCRARVQTAGAYCPQCRHDA